MSKRWIHIAWLCLVLACEEPTNWDLNTQPTNLIVVEAQITNELKNHVVRLTRTVTALNEKPNPVSGATVVVAVEGSAVLFVEFPSGSGMYYSDTVQAVVGKTYHLFINYFYFTKLTIIPSVDIFLPDLMSDFHLMNSQFYFLFCSKKANDHQDSGISHAHQWCFLFILDSLLEQE